VLAEIDRVLKPGGELVFTDPLQANDCPEGVLAPVLERLQLLSLGSFAFYWEEVAVIELRDQLVTHYRRVAEELYARRSRLAGLVSDAYSEHMLKGLGNWIEAGDRGWLTWGVMHYAVSASPCCCC